MGSLLSDTILFEYCKYFYLNIYDSNIATAELLVISAELLAGK